MARRRAWMIALLASVFKKKHVRRFTETLLPVRTDREQLRDTLGGPKGRSPEGSYRVEGSGLVRDFVVSQSLKPWINDTPIAAMPSVDDSVISAQTIVANCQVYISAAL